MFPKEIYDPTIEWNFYLLENHSLTGNVVAILKDVNGFAAAIVLGDDFGRCKYIPTTSIIFYERAN